MLVGRIRSDGQPSLGGMLSDGYPRRSRRTSRIRPDRPLGFSWRLCRANEPSRSRRAPSRRPVDLRAPPVAWCRCISQGRRFAPTPVCATSWRRRPGATRDRHDRVPRPPVLRSLVFSITATPGAMPSMNMTRTSDSPRGRLSLVRGLAVVHASAASSGGFAARRVAPSGRRRVGPHESSGAVARSPAERRRRVHGPHGCRAVFARTSIATGRSELAPSVRCDGQEPAGRAPRRVRGTSGGRIDRRMCASRWIRRWREPRRFLENRSHGEFPNEVK